MHTQGGSTTVVGSDEDKIWTIEVSHPGSNRRAHKEKSRSGPSDLAHTADSHRIC
jgi:hypothetical protein